ncbi:Leucine-rich repeat protein kinase family protein [Rhynchospora pubera]|uniref:Leucine-rich repeat protein kinase family protein n=1 Tax=Rhynchospora pubera TaxID=906938 RepID=A0AAV8HUQ0_9POAL|nr:Leucine-rich repeat protein kinase family protein [Rhynchospora pubera]
MKNYNMREMAFWFAFLASFFLINTGVNGQANNTGFVSIDCGLPGSSSYKDASSTLTYISDAKFIDTGTIHNISVEYMMTPTLSPQYLNVRSFDTGVRNCYTIKSVVAGGKYLMRATFMYGNYDGYSKDVIFDLHIGVNYWKTIKISDPENVTIAEVIFVAPVDYIQVCLVNTGLGTPFISSLDLRPMKSSLYPAANSSQALALSRRLNAGPTEGTIIRYPEDPHDRMWEPWSRVPNWTEITTTSHIQNFPDDLFEAPSAVMQTAATPVNSSEIQFYWDVNPIDKGLSYIANLHFSELMQLTENQKREFNIKINNIQWYNRWFSPDYLYSDAVYAVRSIDGFQRYNVLLAATANSTLPPILNAVELFIVLPVSAVPTDSGDVSAINVIKTSYQITKNWNGDPCAPKTYAWDGLNCSYVVSSSPRITVVSLASNGLTGEITNDFANLKALQTLDLSYNNLTGQIPDVLSQLPLLSVLDLRGNQLNGSIPPGLLKKSRDGSLTLRVENNVTQCLDGTSCNQLKKKHNSYTIAIAIIIVSIVVVVFLAAVGILIIYKFKKQPATSWNRTVNPQNKRYSTVARNVNTSMKLENHQFTYSELQQITNDFQREIGRGGFGVVYMGFLVDGTQVAVKMQRHMSTREVNDFTVEAQHLMRIHHRNLVSLIGYCKDENCLALVLEYMSQGSLEDHLRGSAASTWPLTWKDRIRIAHESAKGLEYLHTGCSPPLIHRDVKPNNILLDAQLEAKIADFGMSKQFSSNDNTHVTTDHVVGTPGYVDPEYHMTCQLTKKSDVYSFGVVILQIVTGQPAIIKGTEPDSESMNLIQWVRVRLTSGDIESVVDASMQGDYNIYSVRKAADVALNCTAQSGAQRPTMTEVTLQLKECIELEAAVGRNSTSNFHTANSSTGCTSEN